MFQKWKDLLFLHWKIAPGEIAPTLPRGLHADCHEGNAYLGLVPFFMQGIRPRFFPAVPWLSNFLEMNVRVYVHDDLGRPGVWFYSLDASQPLAVRIARKLFHLPYFDATMTGARRKDWIDYTCHRRSTPEEEVSRFRYRVQETVPSPEPGSLAHFLLERYLLFAHDPKTETLYSGQVYHTPYPVRKVEVERFSMDALTEAGFELGKRNPDLLHFSSGVDVSVYPLSRCGTDANG